MRERGIFCASHGLEFHRDMCMSSRGGDLEQAECRRHEDAITSTHFTASKIDTLEQTEDQSSEDSNVSFCSLHDALDCSHGAHGMEHRSERSHEYDIESNMNCDEK